MSKHPEQSAASQKLHGLLGMAKRAGRLTIGFDASASAARTGEAKLLLVASDASAKTAKECRFVAQSRSIPVWTLPLDKAQLSDVIGMQKPVGVTAVCDKGFAKALTTALQSTDFPAGNGVQTDGEAVGSIDPAVHP